MSSSWLGAVLVVMQIVMLVLYYGNIALAGIPWWVLWLPTLVIVAILIICLIIIGLVLLAAWYVNR